MFLADAYLHTLDPFAIRFTPEFGIRWYGLAYAFAFVLGWVLARTIARKSWSPLPPQRVADFMFAAILGVLIGARVGYAIFYEPHLFVTFSSSFPFWKLLAIHKGGMSSHGGMIGVILAVFIFGKRNNVSPFHLLDIGGFAAAIGLGIGRLANFVNAELWGRPLPEHMQSYVPGVGPTGNQPPWWSIKYPHEVVEHWAPVVVGQGRIIDDERALLLDPLRSVIGTTNDFYFRVMEKAQAGDPAVVQTLKPLLTAFYPSQIFQAITDCLIVGTCLALIWIKPRKPGVIGSWFLILYGIMRIITEFFRQPDPGVGLTFGILTRGQTLSALMILGGFVCLWLVSRRDVPRIGGLFRP